MSFFKSACIFEAALLPVAIVIGWVVGIDPFINVDFSEMALFYGVVGTLPLILMFLGLQHAQHGALKEIRELINRTLVSRLYLLDWSDLLVLAAIAGVAEEVLFRGVLQPWLEQGVSPEWALMLSALVFGLLHAITPFYALCAALVSIYLGLALDYGGERNLLIPIVIHAVYDFIAFILLVRVYKRGIISHISAEAE